MTAESSQFSQFRQLWANIWQPILDVVTFSAWGILLLRYWLTKQLNLLIHPDYRWLVITAGFSLLILAILKSWELFQFLSQTLFKRSPIRPLVKSVQHVSLFPPGVSIGLLLLTAILGFAIAPRPFASQIAIDRGISDLSPPSRVQAQAFGSATKPEERSLVDWIRTLNYNPEPDVYKGNRVKVQGFVINAEELPDSYFLIARFIITCCAADVYPVGLPVKRNQDLKAYPKDTWLEVEGQMTTETFNQKRQLVIAATSLKPIPEPENPYDY